MADRLYEISIPVNDGSFYQIQTTLDQLNYNLNLRFNRRNLTWYMDVFNDQGEPVLYGIACLTNVLSLIGRFVIVDFMPTGDIIILDANGQGRDPTYENFGSETGPYYVSVV
jgi:hypothetical protein